MTQDYSNCRHEHVAVHHPHSFRRGGAARKPYTRCRFCGQRRTLEPAYQRASMEQKVRLYRLSLTGLSLRKIARQIGLSHTSVRKNLRIISNLVASRKCEAPR